MESDTVPPKDLDEALADVSMRFVLNLPKDQPPSVERLFIHLQQAYWFYEDFLADKFDHLPHLSERRFTLQLFERNPVLKHYKEHHGEYMKRYREYLHSIPAYGAVIMNKDLSKVLLVKSYKGDSYNFPRGKINEAESEVQCAKREVYEEVGYDIGSLIKDNQYISYMSQVKFVKLFIVSGVPEDAHFETQTRKEVGEIRWFPLKEVLNAKGKSGGKNLGPVIPAVGMLKKWLKKHFPQTVTPPTNASKKAEKKSASTDKSSKRDPTPPGGDRNEVTFGCSGSGWSVEEMFAANAALVGRNFDYDGNPHSFADKQAEGSNTSEEASDPKSDVPDTEDERSVQQKSETDTDSENLDNFEFDHSSVLEMLRNNIAQSHTSAKERAAKAKSDIRRLLAQP